MRKTIRVSKILKNLDPETYKMLRFALYAFIIFTTSMVNAVLTEKMLIPTYLGIKLLIFAMITRMARKLLVITLKIPLEWLCSIRSSLSPTGFSCTRSWSTIVGTDKKMAIELINSSSNYPS